MNSKGFLKILQKPSLLQDGDSYGLEEIIEEYPYFQSARALYVKSLKNQDSFRYLQTLKTTAIYTADRSVLFRFIGSNPLPNTRTQNSKTDWDKYSSFEIDTQEDIETITSEKHADFKLSSIDSTSGLHFELALDEFSQNKIDNTDEVGDSTPTGKSEKMSLIDKFISDNPKIKPIKAEHTSMNRLKTAEVEHAAIMTETLAKVYAQQHQYKSAIKAYEILSLKFPEKSGFFADQIRALKKKQ